MRNVRVRNISVPCAVLLFLVIPFGSCLAAQAGVPCDPEGDFSEIFLLPHWKGLPHKNQEETPLRVDDVNSIFGKGYWKFDPKPNHSLFSCLAYAASTVADWWALEFGWPLEGYRSFANGRLERGFNPRKLEVRYLARALKHPFEYAVVPVSIWSDFITGGPIPFRPKGYAKILVDSNLEKLVDPSDPRLSYSYRSSDYPMENRWISLFTLNTNRISPEFLVKAIRDYGPLQIQIEKKVNAFMGTHSSAVIGYGRPKARPGKMVFIMHDCYGDFSKDHPQDQFGAPAYRYLEAGEIDEAIVYPHKPVPVLIPEDGGIRIHFRNSAGRPIRTRRMGYLDSAGTEHSTPGNSTGDLFLSKHDLPAAIVGGRIQVFVEADFYMAPGGASHWFQLPVR